MQLIQKRHRGSGTERGFTLVELLIVVAIIGIIAAILIPNLIDAIQKGKQKRTVGDMRNVGTCWMSWLTDWVGAAAAGATVRTYDLSSLTEVSQAELMSSLYPSQDFYYCQEIPGYDGWGYGLQYYRNLDVVLGPLAIAIRSAGRDGVFNSDSYPVGGFVATDYDQDMVWADGLFIRYPTGLQVVRATATP